MINYYKTIGKKTTEIDNYEHSCWVKCIDPSEKEINYLISNLSVEPEFVRSSLDEEESSHIDRENDSILVIVDSPVVDKTGKSFTYYTNPISIIITKDNIVTISLKENSIIDEFSEGLIKNVSVENKNKFVLQIILRVAGKYLQYLKQINKITDHVEERLKRTMENDELIQFLEIEKSLVYFSSSLRSISGMIEKMKRGRYMCFSTNDYELLEDIAIEFTQATEMSEIYMNILSSTMDAFSSIISNNLNVVMKRLASITLILSIPTIITGIYGMNNPNIPTMEYWWIPFICMLVLSAITWAILRYKKMI